MGVWLPKPASNSALVSKSTQITCSNATALVLIRCEMQMQNCHSERRLQQRCEIVTTKEVFSGLQANASKACLKLCLGQQVHPNHLQLLATAHAKETEKMTLLCEAA